MMRNTAEKIIWAVLFFLVFFSPLPLGSNRPTPLYVIECAVLLGLAAWVYKTIIVDRVLAWIKTPLNVVFGAFLAIFLIQIVLPVSVHGTLPGTYYLRATYESLWKTTAYLGVFWLTLNLIQNQMEMSRLIRGIFILGFAVSLLGIIQKLSGATKLMWFYEIMVDKMPFQRFFATFVNANHFSTFIGMVVLLLLGRFLYLNARYSARHPQRHGEEKVLLLFTLAVSCVALFVSLSRGGILIFALTVFIFYQFILSEKKKARSGLMVGIFVVVSGALLYWIGTEAIVTELSTLSQTTGDVSLRLRCELWVTSFQQIFLKQPFLGTGLGTFQYVFPEVRTPFLFGYWYHAHCDWLEILLEAGVIGFTVIALTVVIFLRETWPVRRDASDVYIRYHGSGILGAILYVLLMSLYDFPLRTPACAVYFSLLAALAVKLRCFQDEALGKRRLRILPLHGKLSRTAACAFAAFVLFVNFAGVTRPYLAFKNADEAANDTVQDLERAVRLDPLDADYHFWLGLALSSEAFYANGKFNDQSMKIALDKIQEAIRLHPKGAKYYYGLATLAQKSKDNKAADTYFRQALEKDPSNPFFHIYYAIFCFNQAMVQGLLNETDVTALDYFQKGLKAYFRAKQIYPGINLTQYKQYVAGYDRLDAIFRQKKLLQPNALL